MKVCVCWRQVPRHKQLSSCGTSAATVPSNMSAPANPAACGVADADQQAEKEHCASSTHGIMDVTTPALCAACAVASQLVEEEKELRHRLHLQNLFGEVRKVSSQVQRELGTGDALPQPQPSPLLNNTGKANAPKLLGARATSPENQEKGFSYGYTTKSSVLEGPDLPAERPEDERMEGISSGLTRGAVADDSTETRDAPPAQHVAAVEPPSDLGAPSQLSRRASKAASAGAEPISGSGAVPVESAETLTSPQPQQSLPGDTAQDSGSAAASAASVGPDSTVRAAEAKATEAGGPPARGSHQVSAAALRRDSGTGGTLEPAAAQASVGKADVGSLSAGDDGVHEHEGEEEGEDIEGSAQHEEDIEGSVQHEEDMGVLTLEDKASSDEDKGKGSQADSYEQQNSAASSDGEDLAAIGI